MYMVVFGVVQIFFSQVPNFHDLWWLSILAAIMSFTYASIAVGLSLAQIISGTIILIIEMLNLTNTYSMICLLIHFWWSKQRHRVYCHVLLQVPLVRLA